MAAEIIKHRMEGVDEGALLNTFAQTLALVSDAVLLLSAQTQTVLLANDSATELFGHEIAGMLLSDLIALDADATLDMTGELKSCALRESERTTLVNMRAHAVPGFQDLLIVTMHETSREMVSERELNSEIMRLKRSNKRLSGVFQIVLETLDTTDIAELFAKILDQVSETMQADGTLVYLAESDGFHLRGLTDGMDAQKTPLFVPYSNSLEARAAEAGHALRARMARLSATDLSAGKLELRDVILEPTHEIVSVRAAHVPPFASWIVVPVWFDGDVIGTIEVGWSRAHITGEEDAALLDAVAHYLSVQLMGAFEHMRQAQIDELQRVSHELREQLLAAQGTSTNCQDVIGAAFRQAASTLHADLLELQASEISGATTLSWCDTSIESETISSEIIAQAMGTETGLGVYPIVSGNPLHIYLKKIGWPSLGALANMGVSLPRYVLARHNDLEPFDDEELAFVRRLVNDSAAALSGQEARAQDVRIAQALQTGMRNRLQQVEGLSAKGIYSSATASAFVGGDFYDLIRLPHARACVIMGDVSGKGIEAASVSAAVRTALGAYSWEGLEPSHMVRLLNDFLLGFSRIETFATMFVGIIDLKSGEMTYCSAGHPPAVIYRAATHELDMCEIQSGVVGAFHEMSYTDGHATFAPGDILFLYTDGTTEAKAPDGNFFGEAGLRDMLASELPGDFDGLLQRLLAHLDTFTGQRLEDDVAMVAVRFDGR